jgi:hypothetical protein
MTAYQPEQWHDMPLTWTLVPVVVILAGTLPMAAGPAQHR